MFVARPEPPIKSGTRFVVVHFTMIILTAAPAQATGASAGKADTQDAIMSV
jgi:hypothetical protein